LTIIAVPSRCFELSAADDTDGSRSGGISGDTLIRQLSRRQARFDRRTRISAGLSVIDTYPD